MTAQTAPYRERPFHRDADRRAQERMERQATMPKDLPSLLRWFEEECRGEAPDGINTSQPWVDRVDEHERDAGVKPVGASDTGALAYNPDMRRVLENGPSQVDSRYPDPDGKVFFFRPVATALAKIGRDGHPLMARHLMLLRNAAFDWRTRADRIGWAHEEYEVYIREALIRLWREHREWVRSN